MVLLRKLAVGGLDLLVAGRPGQAQYLIGIVHRSGFLSVIFSCSSAAGEALAALAAGDLHLSLMPGHPQPGPAGGAAVKPILFPLAETAQGAFEPSPDIPGEAEVRLVLRLSPGQVPGEAPEYAPEEAEQTQDPEHAAQPCAPDEQGEEQKDHRDNGEEAAQLIRAVSARHYSGNPLAKSHADRPFRLYTASLRRRGVLHSGYYTGRI